MHVRHHVDKHDLGSGLAAFGLRSAFLTVCSTAGKPLIKQLGQRHLQVSKHHELSDPTPT
jgi:hypothetical protein